MQHSPFEGHQGRKRVNNWAGNRCGNDRKGRMVRCKRKLALKWGVGFVLLIVLNDLSRCIFLLYILESDLMENMSIA
jgi:hypothetical protein